MKTFLIFISLVFWVPTLSTAQKLFPANTFASSSAAEAKAISENGSKDVLKLRQAATYYYMEAGLLYTDNNHNTNQRIVELAEKMQSLIKEAYRMDRRDPQTLFLYGLYNNVFIGFNSKNGKLNLPVAMRHSSISQAAFRKLRQLEPNNIEAIAYSLFTEIKIPAITERGINKRLIKEAEEFLSLVESIDSSGDSKSELYIKQLTRGVYIVLAELSKREKNKEEFNKYLEMGKQEVAEDDKYVLSIVMDIFEDL